MMFSPRHNGVVIVILMLLVLKPFDVSVLCVNLNLLIIELKLLDFNLELLLVDIKLHVYCIPIVGLLRLCRV